MEAVVSASKFSVLSMDEIEEGEVLEMEKLQPTEIEAQEVSEEMEIQEEGILEDTEIEQQVQEETKVGKEEVGSQELRMKI